MCSHPHRVIFHIISRLSPSTSREKLIGTVKHWGHGSRKLIKRQKQTLALNSGSIIREHKLPHNVCLQVPRSHKTGEEKKKKRGEGGAQKSESLAHINGRKHKCGPKVGKHILPQQDREDLGSTTHRTAIPQCYCIIPLLSYGYNHQQEHCSTSPKCYQPTRIVQIQKKSSCLSSARTKL